MAKRHRRAGKRQSPLARPQDRRDGKPATGGITDERNVVGLDALVEQPLVGFHHVVDGTGVDVLRRAAIIHDQCAAAHRLRDMAIRLAVRVHRADDIAATVRAQQHP